MHNSLCFILFLDVIDNDDIDILVDDESSVLVDSLAEAEIEPLVSIDIDKVSNTALDKANAITERLSNYYFDDRYIKEHPYIPTKIMLEMDNIRRLLKMLMVNEQAQDALIRAIALSPSKSTLYISFTSMQKGTLLIQKQLYDVVSGLEQVFQRMQDDADKQWSEKDKETAADGTITVRGSREFIKQLQKEYYKDNTAATPANSDPTGHTQEDIPDGATPISEIIGE